MPPDAFPVDDVEKLLYLYYTKIIQRRISGTIELDKLVVKKIERRDPCGKQSEFQDAKLSKVRALQNRGIWRVIKVCQIPEDANILCGLSFSALRITKLLKKRLGKGRSRKGTKIEKSSTFFKSLRRSELRKSDSSCQLLKLKGFYLRS